MTSANLGEGLEPLPGDGTPFGCPRLRFGFSSVLDHLLLIVTIKVFSVDFVYHIEHGFQSKALFARNPNLLRIPVLPYAVHLRGCGVIRRIVHPLTAAHAVFVLAGMCAGKPLKPCFATLQVCAESAVDTSRAVTARAFQLAPVKQKVVRIVLVAILIHRYDVSVHGADFQIILHNVLEDILLGPKGHGLGLDFTFKRIAPRTNPRLFAHTGFFSHRCHDGVAMCPALVGVQRVFLDFLTAIVRYHHGDITGKR